jgi:hypothetical protein
VAAPRDDLLDVVDIHLPCFLIRQQGIGIIPQGTDAHPIALGELVNVSDVGFAQAADIYVGHPGIATLCFSWRPAHHLYAVIAVVF